MILFIYGSASDANVSCVQERILFSCCRPGPLNLLHWKEWPFGKEGGERVQGLMYMLPIVL